MSQTNKEKVAIEALRHTEIRLESLNSLASLAETKAMQFAAIITAFTTILAINAKNFPDASMAYVSSGLLLLVAILAVKTAFPKNFHVVGHYWREWAEHYEDDDEFVDVVVSQAKENDERIDYNEKKLGEIAKNFKRSFIALLWVLCFFVGSQIHVLLN